MNTKAETHRRSLGPKPGHLNPQPSPGYARIQRHSMSRQESLKHRIAGTYMRQCDMNPLARNMIYDR